MPGKRSFTISNFAKFARIPRDTLLFYDRIKLLSPVSRGKGGYRFYSAGQIAAVNIIRTAQQLGFSLKEIRNIIEKRTPAMIDELFAQQIGRIDKKIDEWVRARKLLAVLQKIIHSAIKTDVSAITVEFLPDEAIVLGGINDYSRGRDYYNALLSFYEACIEKYPDMDLNYPVWGIVTEQRIRRREWGWPDRYYFYNPEGYDRRPGGTYAIGYSKGGYSCCEELYQKLSDYIEANGYEVCGPAYEEYPHNEICVPDASDYLIRVMIMVKKSIS